jgi:hydrogenase maturation protease
MNILVVGIGQSLRGDDAAGLEAVSRWQQQYPQGAEKVRVELCELPGLALLDMLEGMDAAVLVDALHDPGVTPGMLLQLEMDELAAFNSADRSAHGWGVAETLTLGLSLHPELAHCRIHLIGIAGAQFDLGAAISPQVQASLDEAARSIAELVKKFSG